jgi:hypothetical protein
LSSTDDYRESLYKELYKSELERSDKLDAQINLPTAIITGLLAVGAFYIEHFPRLEWKPKVIVFVLSLLVYGGFLIAGVYCLVRSYFRYQYALLPAPEDIDKNVEQLRRHYEGKWWLGEDEGIDDNIKSDIQQNIISIYMESSSFNRQSNLTRIAWLHWTTRWIIYAIVVLVISRGIYYFCISESKTQEVKIAEMPKDATIHRIQVVGDRVQKVELTNPPALHRVEVVNPPTVQKVQITDFPAVQKVEVRNTTKEAK